MGEKIKEFQKKYPTKVEKEKALRGMTDAQIDALVKDSPNIQQKVFLNSFKKKK